MTRYAVSLGANIGDRLDHLRAGLQAMAPLGDVVRVSPLYETASVGGPDQEPFLNAVVVLDTTLSPLDLLAGLGAIEDAEGRVRTVRWGPRTLDLDIVSSDGEPVDLPGLQVPHPRALERRFVLEPLAEVWPEAPVGRGLSASRAVRDVPDQGVELLARRWSDAAAPRQGRYWILGQSIIFLALGIVVVVDGQLPRGLTVLVLIGVAAVVAALIILLLSIRSLGRYLTAFPEPLPGGALIVTGPYALARHPIYGGLVLLALGIALIIGSLPAALLALILGGFFWMKSGYEERQLRLAYPGYGAYRQRVRKRLVPYLL